MIGRNPFLGFKTDCAVPWGLSDDLILLTNLTGGYGKLTCHSTVHVSLLVVARNKYSTFVRSYEANPWSISLNVWNVNGRLSLGKVSILCKYLIHPKPSLYRSTIRRISAIFFWIIAGLNTWLCLNVITTFSNWCRIIRSATCEKNYSLVRYPSPGLCLATVEVTCESGESTWSTDSHLQRLLIRWMRTAQLAYQCARRASQRVVVCWVLVEAQWLRCEARHENARSIEWTT